MVNELGFRSIDRSAAYKLYVGTSQPDTRSEKLTGKKCLSVAITGAKLDIIYRQAKKAKEQGKSKTKAEESLVRLQAGGNNRQGGKYLMDYGKQYGPAFDVREKAKQHMQFMRWKDREPTVGRDEKKEE